MKPVTIIILAGGKASRFNISKARNYSDKLLSNRGEISLLEFVIGELRSLGDIIVVTRGEKRKHIYNSLLNKDIENHEITIITEESEKQVGPIGGIHSALKLCQNDNIKVILPADLPNIKQGVIKEFITRVSQSRYFDLVSLVHPNGQTENLVLAGINDELLRASRFLIQKGIFRVSSITRSISKKRFINSSNLVNNLDVRDVFHDIDSKNSKSEIISRKSEIIKVKPLIEFSSIDFGLDNSFREKQSDPSILYNQYLEMRLNQHGTDTKVNNLSIVTLLLKESKVYKTRGLISLSLHCLIDVYKINKDPKIANQIKEIIVELKANGKVQCG